MADKSKLKKLNRRTLIDRLAAAEDENMRLKAELDARNIKIAEAGDIAHASLEIVGIFSAAQEAADTYLEEIRRRSGTIEETCAQKLASAQRQADMMLAAAELESRKKLEQADREVEEKWTAFNTRAEAYIKANKDFFAMLNMAGLNGRKK